MRIGHFGVTSCLVMAAVLFTAWLAPASAQQPSREQISAIRASCRSDFMAQCAGVQPGGKDALECLKRNAAKSVAVLQGGARCCWPAADRERGAGTGRAGASPGCGGGASSFRTGCAASGRCGAAGRSPAGSCRGRNQKTAITASRCGPRRLPLRLRRALPGRKAGRLCGAALPASQRRGAVSAMPRRRDGHG